MRLTNREVRLMFEDTLQAALMQMKEKVYDSELIAGGISIDKIRHYGFAFEGKKC